jgi:hypothetical protein
MRSASRHHRAPHRSLACDLQHRLRQLSGIARLEVLRRVAVTRLPEEESTHEVLPTVPGTLEDRKRLRPIGRHNERYQQILDELRKLAVFAHDAGFDVLATGARRSSTRAPTAS